MSAHVHWTGALMGVVASVGVATAAVPPITYLTPDKFTASRGEPVMVRIKVGSPLTAATSAWPTEKLRWFYVLADGTRENHDTVQPTNRGEQAVSVNISRPGVTVIGFDKKPTVEQVPSTDLETFLSRNVARAAKDPKLQRLAPKTARVRRIESAATMVRVPAKDGQNESSAVALSKTGQAVEIRPLFDPTLVAVGSDWPLRVYVGGTKKAGAKVQATSLTGGQTVEKTTDQSGMTYFRITHAGVWRIEFHHAESLENDADADWAIYSATLTFEVPTEGAGK